MPFFETERWHNRIMTLNKTRRLLMKNTLIIGTTGYLGPAIVNYMMAEGLPVFTVNRREPEVLSCGDFVISDIVATPEELESIIILNNITTVLNLAWIGSYGDSRFDAKLQRSNMNLTKVLVTLAAKYKFHLITTGTVSETILNDKLEPVSEYAKAKLFIHNYIRTEADANDFDYTWATLGNVFGGNDRTNRFVSFALNKLTNNESISINTDGNQLFYPLFISDLSRFLSLIIRRKMTGELVLSDNPLTLKEFIEKSKEVLGSDSAIKFGEAKESTVQLELNDKAFKPDYNIEEAIALSQKALEEIK